jgi:site-specific recombinase XerD
LPAAPDPRTAQGRRDHVLLLFLYNNRARASEVAHVKVADLDLKAASVKICGKGKQRSRPSVTVSELATIIAGGGAVTVPSFLNRHGRPITRSGIHTAIERNALKGRALLPTLVVQRSDPDCIRHTTATRLPRLRSIQRQTTRQEPIEARIRYPLQPRYGETVRVERGFAYRGVDLVVIPA